MAGGGTYQEGQQCTVSASANNGFEFSNWTENGNVVSWSTSYTFTVTSNRTFVANFTAQPQNFTITVSANPSNGGTVTGGGTYQQGQSCTVSATANNGYTFTNWTENSNVVSTNASYTFTVSGNRTLVAHFSIQPQAPAGAINGLFTINANGDQVWFSQGNLQYIGSASTPYWKFAENQWDYFGIATNQNSNSHYVDRDLFGWGTSGWDCGNYYYQPWNTNFVHGRDYGPPATHDLTGSYANSDWGVYNPIINGGNQSGQWRTLTSGEWGYVLFSRSTSSGIRFAKAKVNSVNGVIILPDSWSSSYYSLNSTNNDQANFSSNVISATQWNSLEQHGAVFLPAAGYREDTSLFYLDSQGYYWSSSHYSLSVDHSYHVEFSNSYFDIHWAGPARNCGLSVRLVHDFNP